MSKLAGLLLLPTFGLLTPALAFSCPWHNEDRCKERFEELVQYRVQAIESEFGDVFSDLRNDITVKFVSRKSPEYAQLRNEGDYDREHRTFLLPLRLLGARIPNPLSWAVYYWPFYQHRENREAFPVIETVDNLLWTAYLQEAAERRNLTWPHTDCDSMDIEKRLPCEMLMEGISEYVKDRHGNIFNANRLELIWPENLTEFREGLWRNGDESYRNVKHYGGILLVRPLIEEFGLARALQYIAQTPFVVEDDNLRLSAFRYQERARREIM